jgi:hypothetical protein
MNWSLLCSMQYEVDLVAIHPQVRTLALRPAVNLGVAFSRMKLR